MYFRPKKISRFTGIILIFYLLGCMQTPDFVTDENNKKYLLSELKGKYVIFNFWAEWCHPCTREIPELNDLYDETKESGDILVFGVSFDKVTVEELAALRKKLNIRYPLILPKPNPKLPLSLPSALPVHLIMKPDGEIYGPIEGEQNKASLLNMIENLRQSTPSAKPK